MPDCCRRCGGPVASNHRWYCDPCKVEVDKEHHAKWLAKPGSTEKRRARSREFKQRMRQDPVRAQDELARSREYRKQNPDKVKEWGRRGHLRHAYGMSEDDFAQMVVDQGARCLICERAPAKLYIDHDHATGEVRGLLCNGCNVLVGQIELRPDRVKRAEAYIARAHGAESTG